MTTELIVIVTVGAISLAFIISCIIAYFTSKEFKKFIIKTFASLKKAYNKLTPEQKAKLKTLATTASSASAKYVAKELVKSGVNKKTVDVIVSKGSAAVKKLIEAV